MFTSGYCTDENPIKTFLLVKRKNLQRFVEETYDINFVTNVAKATFIRNEFSLQNGRKLSKVNQYLFLA